MSIRDIYSTGRHAIRRLIHFLARPVRRDHGSGGVLIQPYRGFGSAEEIYLMGRVFRQPRVELRLRTVSSQRDLLDVGRRILRRGIGEAVLVARFDKGGEPITTRVTTDREGYFHIRSCLHQPPAADKQWHPVDLELVEPVEWAGDEGAKAQGQIFVPPARAKRVIISDIDDTVMYTGVVNKLMMIWRLFMQGPRSRVAFPGVASLYRALHHGPSGDELNPMLYVSRAPWAIYEVLQEFFRLHRIPVGPILFLREWGLTLQRPLPRRAEDHKLILIRDMLSLYRDIPFVLIGDSGQHDPEIYAQVVQEHPGRVAAVYIRNVSRSHGRVRAIEELARQVLNSGSTLMLAADTFAMAQHAAEHGFIDPHALEEVLSERDLDPDAPPSGAPHEVTEQQTRHCVDQGELSEVLEDEGEADAPPSVCVESEDPPK